MSDSAQFTFLIVVTFGGFLSLTLIVLGHRAIRIYGPWSARFVTVSASTNLCKKIDRLVGPGVEVLIPAGDGRYPLIVGGRWIIGSTRKRRWQKKIAHWVERGGTVTIIISSPNDVAKSYWQSLVDHIGQNLKVYVLNREASSEEDATEIRRLDTFHPILVVRKGEALGMWIENYHPLNSAIAYNVQYSMKKEIVGVQLERFKLFEKILRRLTDDSRRPPQLTRLIPFKDNETAAPNIAKAA